MEKKLKKLFDYQRFAQNEKLERFIQETENRYAKELSDDDLTLVNAAGDQRLSGEIPQEESQGNKPCPEMMMKEPGTGDPKYGSERPVFEAPRQGWDL